MKQTISLLFLIGLGTGSLFPFGARAEDQTVPEAMSPEGPRVTATIVPSCTPTVTPSPTETPTPAPKLCLSFQHRRGPGACSRWKYSDDMYRWYNHWTTWIENPILNQFTYQKFFAFTNNPCIFRAHIGIYGGYAGYHTCAKELKHLDRNVPSPTISGSYDPCNRNCSHNRQCLTSPASLASPMPVSVTHDGINYQLMNKAFSEGGSCGSPDCLCLLGGVVSPLAIDFANQGIQYTAAGGHVVFDLGFGRKETAWIKNGNGVAFLAYDRNVNGKIDDIQELFGSETAGPDGEIAANGFEALRKHDDKQDDVINKHDKIYSSLQLWFDRNSNAVTDPGELVPLTQRNVREINLNYQNAIGNQDYAGNATRQISMVAIQEGLPYYIYDVWFESVHPSTVKGKATKQPSTIAMPRRGEENYELLHRAWQAGVEQEGFGLEEMPFENGMIEQHFDANGDVNERLAIWKHNLEFCTVRVGFDANWHTLVTTSLCF